MVPTRDANYKVYLGRKIAKTENERVDNHKQIREKQLEIQEETRVRQMIKEKKELQRERKYGETQREESKDRADNFAKIDLVRLDHLSKTHQKYQTLDNIAFRAHKDHMTEMEALTEKHRQDDASHSTQSYMRFVRDEQAWLDRRHSLQKRCDKEAADGMLHLQ